MTDTSDSVDTTAARRLDGNAAAGGLGSLFAVDLTVASSRCASCGTTSMLGAHHLYADAPAMVLRCPSCTDVVLRFAPHAARGALRWRFHANQTVEQQSDGWVVVRFRASGMRELAWHLFTWGDKLEILAPERLRTLMVEELETALARHRAAAAI